MKIVELILDEEQEGGIEAISIVESPAIESDFVALESQEVKLAEVDKEKKILLGALLIPNKPIYRNGAEGDYYIFFSKDTIVKASQMYLKNGYQNKSTLEHAKALNGLTLVESWIVESETQDKSRKYGLDVPVGTWMGAVKVDNDKVWDEYVKTNKVKGFSIEGYFADKMEKPKKEVKEDMSKSIEVEAAELLSKIERIVKGEKIELSLIEDIRADMKKANSSAIQAVDLAFKALPLAEKSLPLNENLLKKIQGTKKSAIELGAAELLKDLQKQEAQVKVNIKEIEKLIKGLNSI
tara:strand:+ start:99 stop:983 length:885 start_codon:yes stop_codon:yes gene_type:complete